jgi:hypothetical protein
MDEALLERYRQGEPAAAMAMRNHLRAIATRVLDAPQWKLSSPSDRRRLEMECADLAMNSGADDLIGFAAISLAAAGERGLDALRSDQGRVGGDHPTSRHLVRIAMEGTPSPQMRGFMSHIEECPSCARDLEMVREVLRSATSARTITSAPAPAAPQREAGATRRIKPDAAPSRPAPRRSSTRPQAPQREIKADIRGPKSPRSAMVRSAIPLIAVAVITGGIYFFRGTEDRTQEQLATYAALLPPELPPTDRADELTGTARDAVLKMRAGGCQAAADRLLTEGLRDPENLWLRYYEGLAFVCVRDGPRARAALEAVVAMGGEQPFGLDWWLGQARLLDGDVDGALAVLDRLAAQSHPRSADARALATRIRAL